MKKEIIKFKKGDIVRLTNKNDIQISAKVGALARVVRGKMGRYFTIEWIDKHSLKQKDGKYYPENFEKVSL